MPPLGGKRIRQSLSVINWFAVVVCAVAFIGMLRWKWDIVSVVLGSGLLGLIYTLVGFL
jgi:small-conductance mechanosensitive channel